MACEHLRAVTAATPTGDGCEDCTALGREDWVHLRLCMACGHVGCCDSSPLRHATAHAGDTDHPVIQSFEPGEAWGYCYPDEDVVRALPDEVLASYG